MNAGVLAEIAGTNKGLVVAELLRDGLFGEFGEIFASMIIPEVETSNINGLQSDVQVCGNYIEAL